MTDTSPKPKRRWRWLVILLAVGTVAIGTAHWNYSVSARTRDWLLEAMRGVPLVVKYDPVSIVPDSYDISRGFLTRRQITVVVFDEDDAGRLLAMPPCPVKLVVDAVANTPPEVVTKLRERFGDAVQ